MTEHTKGLWAVNPVLAQVDAFDEGQPLPICQLLWPTDQRSEPETFANARLIAAAPDLLEACEAARLWLAGWASASPYIETLDAAIAKATQP
jgi:hypothetical protein